MKAPLDYLEAAKIQDVASRLEAEGYRVTVEPSDEHDGYDLIAEKPDEKIAVEVAAQAHLPAEVEKIRQLRRRARDEGFNEFRLVVVNPPRQVSVEVQGLEERLREYLADNHPSAIDGLSSAPAVEDVSDLEIETLAVTGDGVWVAGTASLEVSLSYGGSRDGTSWNTSFPMRFEVLLDSESRAVEEAREIVVDTTSFYE